MVKLRKQRRRKVFRHNINRKRMRNKIYSVGNIGCKQIKEAWEKNKSVQTNLEEMGLVYDPNLSIKIPNSKKEFKASIMSNNAEWNEDTIKEHIQEPKDKKIVVETLEEEARAPRKRMFQLPKGKVEWITYLMKKYKNDYRAMARDRKNYYQETWKHIRRQIKTFKGIPEQYNKYLNENGLEPSDSEDCVASDDEL